MNDLCVVDNFLTATVIQFQAMKTTLANRWHPHGGIAEGGDPLVVSISFRGFWVQIHDLPSGLILEAIARHLAIL
ncbi:hypothetical protein CXB51_025467 [Gossypium anomalum]|uniref:DUF4283 domain-containing protein n=1 Tax=Gossypium anomalum TaxID=47600 RepID=A0A8J5YJX7_9ROSI|nr:hypothetical protein CXB51_025467 [Gossypium anomalum]